MATIGGAEGQKLDCKIVYYNIYYSIEFIGQNREIQGSYWLNYAYLHCYFKVGKEFDALLIDVAAVASTGQLPVFHVSPVTVSGIIQRKFVIIIISSKFFRIY